MRAWISVAVAAVLVAGSGTALVTGSSTAAASASSPASGPAKAAALASHLVAEMTFPAGTKPSSLHSIPSALRDSGPFGSHSARAERLLVAPVKLAAAWAVVLAHKPFSTSGVIGAVPNNSPVGSDVLLAAPEPGIAAAMASLWMEPWQHGTTLIAVYGFATWLPVRTAAEHLTPSSFRSVIVSASTIIPRQSSTTRTFTSAAEISRITRFLNARAAAPELAIPCPLPATSYQAKFTPKAKGDPTVTVSGSCLTDQITVNGVAQPLLWDERGGLTALLVNLLKPAHSS